MITISTGGIGPMDITTNTKAKGSSKEEEKAVDAFASLMNMVSSRQDQPEVSASDDMDINNITASKDPSKEYEDYSKQENIDTSKDKFQDTEETSVKEDTQVSKSSDAESKVDEENQIIDKVVALIKEVKETLKEALGLTDEELNSLLADMGIDVSELMIGDNLKNFILQAQGATNVELLVNENLAKLVSDVTNQVANLVEQYGFTDAASFEQLVVDNVESIEMALQNSDKNVDINVDGAYEIKNDNVQNFVGEEAQVESSEFNEVKTKTEGSEYKVDSKVEGDGLTEKVSIKSTSETGQDMAQSSDTNQNNHQIAANLNQAIDNTVNVNANIDTTAFVDNIQEADIIRQIIDQIKVNVGREVQSMEVQLNPENLGKVYVNVEAKDGVMQAKIIAETEAAKNAIENNLAVLKENFSNNELKVEAIEVMVAAYGFFDDSQNGDFENQEQTNDTSKTIGGINVNNLDEEELTEEEELEVEIMKTKGNTVSYTV
ncbi:MAG: flagellar hook-length control protein FliK [Lachnospiraceae bacterium]|nr:flagellar hook-length control protein FliK [Lachnospiraceae bacterium]